MDKAIRGMQRGSAEYREVWCVGDGLRWRKASGFQEEKRRGCTGEKKPYIKGYCSQVDRSWAKEKK